MIEPIYAWDSNINREDDSCVDITGGVENIYMPVGVRISWFCIYICDSGLSILGFTSLSSPFYMLSPPGDVSDIDALYVLTP